MSEVYQNVCEVTACSVHRNFLYVPHHNIFQVGQKPVGIVGIGSEDVVGIVRKQVVSWVRPMDALDLLALASLDSLSPTSLDGVLTEDAAVISAVVALAKPLRLVRESLPVEVAAAFTLDLHHLQPPDQVQHS